MVRVSNNGLVMRRLCTAKRTDGQRCGMPPMADSGFCWAHDPANAEAAAEARRMGGLRRKKEGSVQLAYGYGGLGTVDEMRRLLEIVTVDTLSLDNGVPRNRTVVAIIAAATKLLETGELAERVEALEAIVKRQGSRAVSASRTAGRTTSPFPGGDVPREVSSRRPWRRR